MLKKESEGLDLLRDTNALVVPTSYPVLNDKEHVYLVLDYVPTAESQESYLSLGTGLAKLHKTSKSDRYGLEYDNYIGTLKQENLWQSDFYEFYIINRIGAQFRLAYDGQFFFSSDLSAFNKLCSQLHNIIPNEEACLIHGDLWSGNVIYGDHSAYLIDPAVSYAHREQDIAMMHLFGGFDPAVFRSYNEHYPLESGWKSRMDLFQLYYLLVHVNLFGGSYVAGVKSTLKKYS